MFQGRNDISKFLKLLKQSSDESLHTLGKFYVDEMKQRTPVDKGALRNSCKYKIINNKLHIINDEDYAGYVEFGTYKMNAQPFARPAVFDNIQKATQILKGEYNAGLE